MKGDYKDECYRTACKVKPATYFNHSTLKHYCPGCAMLINMNNASDAYRLFGHDLCTRVAEVDKMESSPKSLEPMEDQTEKDIQFLEEMNGITKSLLYGSFDVTKLQYLDKMIEDWHNELIDKKFKS